MTAEGGWGPSPTTGCRERQTSLRVTTGKRNMCGIVGQIRNDGKPVDRGLIDGMCAALEHRGPDSRGVHLSPRVGLGIQRLRVIDLATGDQPIYNEDRSIAVVLNGEI